MLDLSHIPNSQQDIKIFYTNGSANAWQTWTKPKKCNYVWIMCIGGGGGGASGLNLANFSYSTGGGGGGISRVLYNSQQLSDTLYVQVGVGGTGATPTVAGTAGTRSFVSLTPIIAGANSIAGSGTAGAAVGTSGTGVSAAGEPVTGQGNIYFLTLANFLNTAGVTAVGAGTIQAPDITPLTSQVLTCGAGASGFNTPNIAYNGASILATSISPLIAGGAAAPTVGNGGNGGDGITSWKPFYSLGGAGGGSSVVGVGGNGGNGGIGSGGGAGGAGFLGGGNGGKGGDGLVVIISF